MRRRLPSLAAIVTRMRAPEIPSRARKPFPDPFDLLALAWTTISGVVAVLLLEHILFLRLYAAAGLGKGLTAEGAAVGLLVAAASALVGADLARRRGWVRRPGAILALLGLLVALFLSTLAVGDGFRYVAYLAILVDATLLWTAAAPGSPLRLPRANRDQIVILYVIVGIVLSMAPIYGVGIFQYLINGLVVGSIYVLGATGLSLIFGIRKFANFAHGEFMTFGAYMALFVNGVKFLQLNIVWGFLFAIVMTAGLAMVLELVVFRRLAGRGPVSLLVASIGVSIFLQNMVAAIFGTDITGYNLRISQNITLLAVDGAPVLSINPVKGIATLVVIALLTLGLHVLLSRTTLGKAMRATADNPDLARASGINIRNVILWTWAIGGALAAIAGVLLGVATDVRTAMGFNVLLFVFAAVIVGGLGSPYGAMFGGLVVGVAQELAVPVLAWLGRPTVLGLPSAVAYKPVAAFAIMILVLLIRPEGLAGAKGSGLAGRGWRRRLTWSRRREEAT